MTARPDRARLLAGEALRASRRPGSLKALLLDLDGTLAPLVQRPEAARVPDGVLDSLRTLAGEGWILAVVSGRPARSARRMMPLRGVRIFGSHGLEGAWRGPGRRRLDPRIGRRLKRILQAARRASRGIPGVLVESKPAGVGLHDRRVPAAHLSRWRRRVRHMLEEADLQGLEILRGHRVVEIRPVGWSKGRVVRTFPGADSSSRRDPSFLALGDDRTDEDMFRAIRGRGLGVLVGPPGRKTAATRRLASPLQVGRFLAFLAGGGR